MKWYACAIVLAVLAALPVAGSADEPRGPLNDGSFEQGACGAGSAWTCLTNTSCPNWILVPDPVWGVPAYDGKWVAQLGGLCGEEENSNSFCQEVTLHGECLGPWVQWHYLAIVDGGEGGTISVTIDGDEQIVWPEWPVKDTGGLWLPMGAYTFFSVGLRELCFEFTPGTSPSAVLIDMIGEWVSPTATAEASLSTVKSRY